jgi:hypothetical protein
LDLEAIAESFKPLVRGDTRPTTLKAVKDLASRIVANPKSTETVLGMALGTLGVPHELWTAIHLRWRTEGRAALPAFAPYAAHVVTVDLFFSLSIAAGLIAKERPSNRADIAYLYYLPFCMVFASMDKLHARTVPLFLKGRQQFLWGADLKADLKRIDNQFFAFPDDVKARGVMSFAHAPPHDRSFLTTRLWDEFMSPTWRTRKSSHSDVSADVADPRIAEALLELKQRLESAVPAERDITVKEADFVIAQSRVPRTLGKWAIVPPEA